VLNCQELAQSISVQVKSVISHLPQKHRPCLAVVIVGDDPASKIYVENKLKKCTEMGILCQHFKLPAEVSSEELLDLINQLNNDDAIHGILVQMPLPKHIPAQIVINAISPTKDVDGFSSQNAGLLAQGLFEDAIIPCTPKGILYIIDFVLNKLPTDYSKNKYAGLVCVILGRSDIVGKPLSIILTNLGATVITCNKSTLYLDRFLALADILIVAIGSAKSIELSALKNHCLVIDVGINIVHDHTKDTVIENYKRKICGDISHNEDLIKQKSLIVTPVPKGVGPMTIAMLMSNVLSCYHKKNRTIYNSM
jgi:methylenetetrahydrofolate dehydrogenase (NADP+)/methenyltetrahydrofolate cyclohydrolase